MVTIEKLLKDGIKIIRQREFNNPFLDVQLILSHLLKQDKIYLHVNRNKEVDDITAEKFYDMVEKRNSGYPLQYMTNSQEFMGLDFYVQKGVLVPRPDTEVLVEKIIDTINTGQLKNKNINILDIGTGSGAIAVSLGYYLKNADITAMDISDTAIETVSINIKRHGLTNVRALKADIFNFDACKKYDIVVSNPPYIEREIIRTLPEEVSVYEPKLALDGGKDGLDYYRQIIRVFDKIRGENAMLFVEIGYDQKQKVTEILNRTNIFKTIEGSKDLSGNDRVVTGMT
ncbi:MULTISPECIES: peptide chain release factor N(5)-glutamine methyltransferase [unclassified Sedimentibacter]|uniref:peptide chain release factor N(5)-glutamine methyltransferase n=1 Tax=unclassified Sedimentibacter TaxID=2649220 RepID=UPI0027E0D155|nr:peptide chain release factor N(5)-glutamine methyltransferase [Sedimentibacter sp. MB35-C1]WMJ77180.1 peptide chain release factor N(5)-glutamine methyltransferase [Sedimentibacter sp. MB35-C1]